MIIIGLQPMVRKEQIISRKDNKGRVLKEGESQRKNLTYMYRYTDVDGSRRSMYAKTLNDLREKENQIQIALSKNESLVLGKITVIELLEDYLNSRRDLKPSSMNLYESLMKIIKDSKIAHMKISDVNPRIAKKFFIDESNKGVGYSSLCTVRNGILYPAFRQAYEDEYISRNPFDFKLNIEKPKKNEKHPLTCREKKEFLTYTRDNERYHMLYLISSIMLNTGLRVSEAAGLTFSDIDFDNRTLTVNKQLQYNHKAGSFYISTPKSKSGNRVIPLNVTAIEILYELKQSDKTGNSPVVDGITDFIFLNKDNKLYYNSLLCNQMNNAVKKYNKEHSFQLPNITPHLLRHTFCSELAKQIDVKSLQYLMGHSSSNMTLDVYTHVNLEDDLPIMRNALNEI